MEKIAFSASEFQELVSCPFLFMSIKMKIIELEFCTAQIRIGLLSNVLHLFFSSRELCMKLYSMSWGNTQSWQEFDRICEYNPVEVPMLTCLADVREPCQLGCRNLTYCTNFNNR